jgi:hypothetical protein
MSFMMAISLSTCKRSINEINFIHSVQDFLSMTTACHSKA